MRLDAAAGETPSFLTVDATEAGIVLGTPGDMAPEHAQGEPADRGVDIWAFGVML
jgi:serine/threonine protein kinase